MILHICSQAAWTAARQTGEYRAESLETEGFIHCSLPDQVVATAHRYYRGRPDLVLLRIDPRRVLAEVKVELAKNGQHFPHIYGPLNTDAVDAVIPFAPGPDGDFTLPDLGQSWNSIAADS